jgi:hypothetical protein
MKKLLSIMVLGLLLSGSAYAENLSLLCKGDGSRKTGTGTAIVLNKDVDGAVILNLNNNKGDISIPAGLLPGLNRTLNFLKKDKKNKFKLYNIKITEPEITANFKLNPVNKPSVKIDRYTGILFIEGLNLTFNAECEKFEKKKKKF